MFDYSFFSYKNIIIIESWDSLFAPASEWPNFYVPGV